MSFLEGLHGVAALALLCGLLFAEEAGVPLPFAPGEIVLLAGGLLVAAGGLNPLLFVPLAIAACVGGSMVGFGWAGLVGPGGLDALARRFHREKALGRVVSRVRSAGPRGIAVTRLIPGLRIYTTLVAGALRVSRRTFVTGMVPATAAWVVVFVVLGDVVGLPVEHLFTRLEKLAVQGAILIVIGLGGYFAIRHTPGPSGGGLVRVRRPIRVAVAAAVDVGVVMSLVTGVLALVRLALGVTLGAGWLDAAIALLIVAVFYVVIARRGAGSTVGEALLQTTYVSGRSLPLRPRAAWQAARDLLAGSADELRPTADLLRALGNSDRLRLVRYLLDRPQSVEELSAISGTAPIEVLHQLHHLDAAGLLVVESETATVRYCIRPSLLAPLLDFLATSQASLATPLGQPPP